MLCGKIRSRRPKGPASDATGVIREDRIDTRCSDSRKVPAVHEAKNAEAQQRRVLVKGEKKTEPLGFESRCSKGLENKKYLVESV